MWPEQKQGPTRQGTFDPLLCAPSGAACRHPTLGGTTLDTPASYLNLGFIILSLPNLLLIAGMVLLFAVALFLPCPHGDSTREPKS